MSHCECESIKRLSRACSIDCCPRPTPKDLLYRDMTQGVVYKAQELGPSSFTFQRNPIERIKIPGTLAFRSRYGICPEGWVAGENNMCYPTNDNGQGLFYESNCDIRDQRVMKY